LPSKFSFFFLFVVNSIFPWSPCLLNIPFEDTTFEMHLACDISHKLQHKGIKHLHLVLISSFKPMVKHTSHKHMTYKFKNFNASKHMLCTTQMHKTIKVHELAPPTCMPHIVVRDYNPFLILNLAFLSSHPLSLLPNCTCQKGTWNTT
jgi:hypothetical protein